MGLSIRSEISAPDTWDLSPLYSRIDDWEKDFKLLETRLSEVSAFVGSLGQTSSHLAGVFKAHLEMYRTAEKLYVFAHLLSDQDTADGKNLALLERATNLYTRLSELWSFFTPEILSLSESKLQEFLSAPELESVRRLLKETLRYRPHTLSQEQELLLASAAEPLGVSERTFSQLNNADLTFGSVKIDGQELPLSHGNFVLMLKNQNRSVREEAFNKYYGVFEQHKNTIASLLAGSIKRDVFFAKVKKFPSAREMALFGDNVSTSVYDNLLTTVGSKLSALHKYYQLRKKISGLSELRMFDTYVPLVPEVKTRHSFEEAADFIAHSLSPLGDEYISILKNGLLEKRWVDRYENKGKRSGAYSSGCYDSPPYILMNYKADSLDDMFTLTHEAGHSMHSYFSIKNQSYQDHSYTIFVAEVASTFNEQLLSRFLQNKYKDDPLMLAYLINEQIEDIKATLYRQTMFAEFEKITHELAENNQALTVDVFRKIYRELLQKYFGEAVSLSELDDLECLRIPHFYSAFYVYKYATGLSAAIALSERVLGGSNKERQDYLNFLKGGCSKYPLELLQLAGVDMNSSSPISAALELFSKLVDRLEVTLLTL